MLEKLSSRHKKILSYVLAVLVFYLCYVLAFAPTLDAVSLHSELQSEKKDELVMEGSYTNLQRKNNFYKVALKAYHVKNEEREQRLWQAVSGMAIAQQVDISLEPQLALAVDTTMHKEIVEQHFNFTGDYFGLVKLLDTLHRNQGNGRIGKLKISSNRGVGSEEFVDGKLDMSVTLKGVLR